MSHQKKREKRKKEKASVITWRSFTITKTSVAVTLYMFKFRNYSGKNHLNKTDLDVIFWIKARTFLWNYDNGPK